MTTILRSSSPGERDRSAARTSSFEQLLEEMSRELDAHAGGADAGQRALDHVADFFGAESVIVRVESGLEARSGAEDEGSAKAAEPDLRVSISGITHEIRGSAELHAKKPGQDTDADAERLRVAAWTLVESLRRTELLASLKEERQQVLMAMMSATTGTWDWDLRSDRVSYLTPHANKGRPQRTFETTGASWFKETHPQDVHIARPGVERAISGQTEGFAMLVRMRSSHSESGEWRYVYSRGRVVERDARGRALRMMGTFEDVSEAQKDAQEIATREVAMARASRMASLGAFASSLAHELNQPLASLTGLVEGAGRLYAKGAKRDAEIEEALERSLQLAHKASSVVRRFRNLLRYDTPADLSFDLEGLLVTVRQRLRSEALAAGVELFVAPRPEELLLRADVLQAEEAVVSLVRNGIEACQGVSGRSHCVTLSGERTGDFVQIRVSDTGEGVPDEVKAGLFDPFTSTKGPSRGLGLLVCQSIAELHGGQVRLESTGPEGTLFVLELPAAEGEQS